MEDMKLKSLLTREYINGIKRAVNDAISEGKSRFEIVFSGGTKLLIKDIKSLNVTEKSMIFDNGRYIDIRNVCEILADDEAIVIIE
ncbi:MAG: hypothetical protein P1P80_01870 [ANME-2 cluster archaeon]|nr:hypothetical protein [ANME-2 cluster archaeon]